MSVHVPRKYDPSRINFAYNAVLTISPATVKVTRSVPSLFWPAILCVLLAGFAVCLNHLARGAPPMFRIGVYAACSVGGLAALVAHFYSAWNAVRTPEVLSISLSDMSIFIDGVKATASAECISSIRLFYGVAKIWYRNTIIVQMFHQFIITCEDGQELVAMTNVRIRGGNDRALQ
ncbi:MAG: hypothetical protein K2Q20_06260 [Phycisphaerales bacterium]|nr:hypothetical protein [Phycisphaerales bacterium]